MEGYNRIWLWTNRLARPQGMVRIICVHAYEWRNFDGYAAMREECVHCGRIRRKR